MTRAERAKQFLPFSGLAGLDKALAKKEFIPDERKVLGEDALVELDYTMRQLHFGDMVTVVYYRQQKYVEATGTIRKIDLLNRVLFLVDTKIPMDDLVSISRH